MGAGGLPVFSTKRAGGPRSIGLRFPMMHSVHMPTLHRGFTLIELLVCIAIIGVLASLVVPAMQNATKRSNAIKGLGNLRQLGIAFHMYLSDHDYWLPILYDGTMYYPKQLQPYTGGNCLVWNDPNRTIRGTPDPWQWSNNPLSYATHENVIANPPSLQPVRKLMSIPRPSSVVLFVDCTQQASGLWSNCALNGLGYATYPNTAQMLDPSKAEDPIPVDNDVDPQTKGYIRYRQPGAIANTLFVDGHATGMKKGDLKNKNFSTSY